MENNRLLENARALANLYKARAEIMTRLRHQREDLETAEIAAKPSAEVYATLGSNKEARELAVEKMLADNQVIRMIKTAISDLTDTLGEIEADINGNERMFQAFNISVANESNTIYGRRDIIGSLDLASGQAGISDDAQTIVNMAESAQSEMPDYVERIVEDPEEFFMTAESSPEDAPANSEPRSTKGTQPKLDDDIPF